jgi:hypothetical protein
MRFNPVFQSSEGKGMLGVNDNFVQGVTEIQLGFMDVTVEKLFEMSPDIGMICNRGPLTIQMIALGDTTCTWKVHSKTGITNVVSFNAEQKTLTQMFSGYEEAPHSRTTHTSIGRISGGVQHFGSGDRAETITKTYNRR